MRLLGFEVIQTPALPCRLKGQPCLVWKVQGRRHPFHARSHEGRPHDPHHHPVHSHIFPSTPVEHPPTIVIYIAKCHFSLHPGWYGGNGFVD